MSATSDARLCTARSSFLRLVAAAGTALILILGLSGCASGEQTAASDDVVVVVPSPLRDTSDGLRSHVGPDTLVTGLTRERLDALVRRAMPAPDSLRALLRRAMPDPDSIRTLLDRSLRDVDSLWREKGMGPGGEVGPDRLGPRVYRFHFDDGVLVDSLRQDSLRLHGFRLDGFPMNGFRMDGRPMRLDTLDAGPPLPDVLREHAQRLREQAERLEEQARELEQ